MPIRLPSGDLSGQYDVRNQRSSEETRSLSSKYHSTYILNSFVYDVLPRIVMYKKRVLLGLNALRTDFLNSYENLVQNDFISKNLEDQSQVNYITIIKRMRLKRVVNLIKILFSYSRMIIVGNSSSFLK